MHKINYDITINTHGDKVPFYDSSFSKDNAITYCHFPTAKYHIESENIDYLKTDLGMTERSNIFSDNRTMKISIIENIGKPSLNSAEEKNVLKY